LRLRPYRTDLRVADAGNRVEEIVVHRDREGLVFLLNENRDQILAPAFKVHPPQRVRQIKSAGLKKWDQAPNAVFFRQLAAKLNNIEALVFEPLLLQNNWLMKDLL
jgi:hypothetical protein